MRIVTSVGVVFDHEATSKLEAGVGGKATLTKLADQDVELKVDTEFQNDYKVQISDGTIVAYQCGRPVGPVAKYVLVFMVGST